MAKKVKGSGVNICPCGKTPVVVSWLPAGVNAPDSYKVYCTVCGESGPVCGTRERAVSAWNRRVAAKNARVNSHGRR